MDNLENKDEEYTELEILRDANLKTESELTSTPDETRTVYSYLEELRSSGITGSALGSINLPREDYISDLNLPVYMPPSKEEEDGYQSSGALLKRLHSTMVLWRKNLSEDMQPAILAILYGGIQINVDRLIEESFHGIRIEGKLKGSTCMILAHQSTVQLLCLVIPVNKEIEKKKPIGFVIEGKEQTV